MSRRNGTAPETHHPDSLPQRYFEVYGDTEIDEHSRARATLSPDNPIRISGRTLEDEYQITICTRDAPGLFSYLSGILGARGFNTIAGEIFTSRSGFVVDSFRGTLPAKIAFDRWISDLQIEFTQVLIPLFASPPREDETRETVVEAVSRALAHRHVSSFDPGEEPLLPIEIGVTGRSDATEVRILSQDTPFFLYSLSSALALQDLSIREIQIDTEGRQVRDVFLITKRSGQALVRTQDIERLRLSILVTKQFTHVLDLAADPRDALIRFEELVRRIAIEGSTDRLQRFLADPEAQRELAQLLGASDFLWEDFIRLQYESLLPMLGRAGGSDSVSTPSEELAQKIDQQLAVTADDEKKRAILNRFKDDEAYLIDVDHILQRNTDFFFLSHRLSRLAEVVVSRAFSISWEHLHRRYGAPRSAAGLAAEYAVFGLGKLGGSALGYASDIELMTVYSDQGDTSGPKSISNREFFERLVEGAARSVVAKRESIFEVDLRLRPYGSDGPRAVHLESFIEYFGPGGKSHSVERLALIRMRPIAGSAGLGERVTAIRDQLIYERDSIDVSEIRELRTRQAEEKGVGTRLNAKFSPGALVDLEYNVQLLQIEHGRSHPALRDPGIHATLRGLSELGTIDPEEAESMIRSYRFLRNLINGLRMLRGHAQDLFLPDFDSLEALHLARRMGYRDGDDLSAAEQLRVDFEVETAAVRSFVERHLGRDALPECATGNPADLVLSDSLSEKRSAETLAAAGFRNPSRGVINLRRMAGSNETREIFARLVVLAWEYLRRSSDPDMALNNWDRFTEQVGDRRAFFSELLAQPRRMEIMLVIFAGSQFLSDTLIRNPSFLEWISRPDVVALRRDEDAMVDQLLEEMQAQTERTEKLNVMRRFRRREILRIGAQDICLGGDFRRVVQEISALARAVTRVALEHVLDESPELREKLGRFVVFAFGKLGGNELNYSSDIDLLAVYEPDEDIEEQEKFASRVMRQLVRDLTDFTLEGQAYRVDLRLRPWGNAGRLVYAVPTLGRYYTKEAELWEIQALLKLSPIAGDIELGHTVLEELYPVFTRRLEHSGREQILHTVRQLRARAVTQYGGNDSIVGTDIKNDEGGIRDVEFLVQALQMLHHGLYPGLLTGNTLAALSRLEEAGILDSTAVIELRDDYLLLRRIEHFLQVYDDQQLHAIPTEVGAQRKLARIVMSNENAGVGELVDQLTRTLKRVRERYLAVVGATA